MSDPPEDETQDEPEIDFEAILNRIATANRRTRRRTLVGPSAYLNIVDMSSNIVIQPIDSSENESNITQSTLMQPDITNTLNRLLQSSFHDKAKYKKVLSSKGETELEDLSYNTNLNTNSRCPILQIDFTDGMDIIKLPCNHCFIPEAITRWLKEENALCPVCRYNLDSQEVEVDNGSTSLRPSSLFAALSRSHAPSLLSSIIQPEATASTTVAAPTANNFLQDIIERVLVEQQEEELQQAIINSLNDN
jgi:hypothetical protein